MIIPVERLRELRERALAADVEPTSDPGELARRSIRAHREDMGETVPPEPPEVGIQVHRPGHPEQGLSARETRPILAVLQELITSIGRDVTQMGAFGVLTSAAIFPGLQIGSGPLSGPVLLWRTEPGDEVPGNVAFFAGDEMVADATMSTLFAIIDHSGNASDANDDGELALELRRLSPQSTQQLSSLADTVMRDGIELDLTWRTARGHRQKTRLPAHSASTLQDVIKLNADLPR